MRGDEPSEKDGLRLALQVLGDVIRENALSSDPTLMEDENLFIWVGCSVLLIHKIHFDLDGKNCAEGNTD